MFIMNLVKGSLQDELDYFFKVVHAEEAKFFFTSYFLFTKDKKPDWALSLHRKPVLDVLILILFTFHSIYGLRTVAIDLRYRSFVFKALKGR